MVEPRALSELRISKRDMSILIRGETIDVAAHRHHALQVSIGLDEPFDFECNGQTVRAKGVVNRSDVVHKLDSRGGEVAVLLLEPEELSARRIATRWLGKEPFALLPEPVTENITRIAIGSSKEAANPIDGLIAALSPAEETLPRMDMRIAGLLNHLRRLPEKRVTLGELAKEAGLSESRLTHLFKQETGVSIRRYLLWLRLNDAMSRAIAGASLTEAAHGAGFSDSAHLTRTCREMFGINPFAVVRHSRFVQAQENGGA